MTQEQKRAIKRICEENDFEDVKELKAWMKDMYGDTLDNYWFEGTTEDECYAELDRVVVGFN